VGRGEGTGVGVGEGAGVGEGVGEGVPVGAGSETTWKSCNTLAGGRWGLESTWSPEVPGVTPPMITRRSKPRKQVARRNLREAGIFTID
jgi:hypothetical protein